MYILEQQKTRTNEKSLLYKFASKWKEKERVAESL